jgi:hypothetical protein
MAADRRTRRRSPIDLEGAPQGQEKTLSKLSVRAEPAIGQAERRALLSAAGLRMVSAKVLSLRLRKCSSLYAPPMRIWWCSWMLGKSAGSRS